MTEQARGQLWAGRFAAGPAEALQALNDSLPFDRRMFREDIAGSRAHVAMLADVGLFDPDDRDRVLGALDVVEAELAGGTFVFAPGDEDIHTAVERRVTELEPAGARMHTGRSRNDQVATDLRLWTRAAIGDIVENILAVQGTLVESAAEAGDAYLPGYTHLQQAQPVALAHHLLAHVWALARDVDRLLDARVRMDVSVLGAGALAGSSLPLDPHRTAVAMGFAGVFDNSLDAVSDRDFVAETLFALALCGVHLSRIGEEMILWASTEFGFVELDDAFSTGSSMMPQKKNPDIAELARGKAGRLIGHLTGFLATLKGLPLTYNKDLQEDKEPLFDAVDTIRLTLLALDGMLATLRYRTDRMAAQAASPYAAATDLAEWLVARGVAFRDAHHIVGDLVRRALAGESDLVSLVGAHDQLGPDAAALLAPGVSVTRRTTHGGGSPSAVADQLQRARPSGPGPHEGGALSDGDRRLVDRAFFGRDPLVVAPELLGMGMVSTVDGVETAGRIVEVEAYRGTDDPGSHGYRGPTPRTEVMFGPPGHLYVYFSYGMHWCTNIVCGADGTCAAVLVRALTPLVGLETMRRRRPAARRDRDLCSGPAKLSAALAIDGSLDGIDLGAAGSPVRIEHGDRVEAAATSARIGLSPGRGEDLPWRWYVPGVADVSARPR